MTKLHWIAVWVAIGLACLAIFVSIFIGTVAAGASNASAERPECKRVFDAAVHQRRVPLGDAGGRHGAAAAAEAQRLARRC